jgi:Tfp pilus assembly protein PilX
MQTNHLFIVLRRDIQLLRQNSRRRQRGVALVFLLIMLLGIAMLAILANRSAILESRSTRAGRDHMIARSAAEAALTDFNKAMGNKDARVFQKNILGELSEQTGGCDATAVVLKATASSSGTQKAGGTSTPGVVNFQNCNFPEGEWWQALKLSQIEDISTEIGTITGDTQTGYDNVLGRSAAKPRIIVEPMNFVAGGAAAFSNGAGWAGSGRDSNLTVFRVTALGYGPTKDTVVLLQETWRTQD